jgi:hypothetical protein
MGYIMKNIGFCKAGKSVKFKTNKYSPIGGDNEASCTLRAVANNNPDKNFYIVGRSDFATLTDSEKVDLFPYGNVIDAWEGVALDISQKYFDHLINYFKEKDIVLDFTIMMVGQLSNVTIPDRIQKVREGNDGKPAATLDMTKWYTTPIIAWLNQEKVPYIEIVNDPRYTIKQPRDLFHMPMRSLGQYDYTYETFAIRDYVDQERITRQVKSEYAGMETAFCGDYVYAENVNVNRNTDFMVVLNEGKPSRYGLLKEWVLDEFNEVEIYGKWEHEAVSNDSRFKGSLHINELQKKLQDVKFTFIIPIAPGWVTSKYIEMIHAGVIPFLHPTYDSQKHLPIPDFLRPNTPAEFYERMQTLINNKDQYETVLKDLRNAVLKSEYYDGSFINNKIMKAFDSNYEQPNLVSFEKKHVVTLEDFFS